MVQVHHDEGVAIHIDPESCAVAREGNSEALTGERAGQPLSRESTLLALLAELLADGPWPRPHRRVFDGHDIFQRGRASPRPAFNQMQVLARTPKISFGTKVRDVDDEGVALPVATRVAVPLVDVGREMGAAVHNDVALPALAK